MYNNTEKLKISQAIIVEGKYDKIKLKSFVDAVIIVTNGFQIYKDKEKAQLMRYYAKSKGIIILTDSDSAGFKIRGHIKSICPEGKIINVYIPDIFGKEKRKIEPSREGKLGVEGINVNILRDAFEKAGVVGDIHVNDNPVTKPDMYEDGLTGRADSSQKRKILIEYLSLPQMITPNGLLEVINSMFTKEEYKALLEKLGII